MASKFGFAGGIPERRVRPIWDAVDSRQFKHALKLSVALLAKYPNSPYALALKALICERMGKPDEALSICLEAKELLCSQTAVFIDDLTLSTLQIVFQRLNRLDMATACYEHACTKYPNNLEIIMGLFNCYVREYAFVKQQQTAIKMYKIVGEERFLLWAVCSIQLQVFCSNGGEKLLSLAEALLKKHISSHSLHEPEALIIYISVLEQQAKYRDAIEILSGDMGSLIGIEADKLRMQGRLLARARDHGAAADILQNVLELCPDDWESFLQYLGCLLEEDIHWPNPNDTDQIISSKCVYSQACNRVQLSEEVFEERISKALSFVKKLQLDVDTEYVRCPYLAIIEIERQRRLKGKCGDTKILDALVEYFHRFSHLSCFTSDVEVFLPSLTECEKTFLLEEFDKKSESPLASPIKALGRAITLYKARELFGVNLTISVADLESTAKKMVDMYCINLPLSRDLDPQENMHGEELLSIASSALVMLFWRTRNLGYLLEAVLVLEFGLTVRKYLYSLPEFNQTFDVLYTLFSETMMAAYTLDTCKLLKNVLSYPFWNIYKDLYTNVWPYKILLLHLYSFLGALPLAYEWYDALDVKNILLETASHHIVPQMLKSPFLSGTTDLLDEYLKFIEDYLREAADLTFLAYRHRNYSKVIEFVQFKERLGHSSQYLMARIDASILQLKQQADDIEEVECILESLEYGNKIIELSEEDKLKSLTFNEDLRTRPWWSPSPDVNHISEHFDGESICLKSNSFKLDRKVETVRKSIMKKSLVPRLVYLSTQTASCSLKDNLQANGTKSDSKTWVELKQLLERYVIHTGFQFDDAKMFILDVAKGHRSSMDFGSDVVDWINFAVFMNAWHSCSHRSTAQNKDDGNLSLWHIVNNLIKTCITEQLSSAQPLLTNPGSNCPVLVQLITESLSWHMLIIQSYLRSVTLPQGKKKKKNTTNDQSNLPLTKAIRDSIDCLIGLIRDVSKWISDQTIQTEDEKLDILLSHAIKKGQGQGPGSIIQILEVYSSSSDVEVGERVGAALQSWNSASVLRKTVAAQTSLLSKFGEICEAKLTLLEKMKRSI